MATESGFFAGASHEDNLSTSHEYKLRLGDVIYQLADGRWMFVGRAPRIVLRSRMKDGNVEIDIADNGPGIAPEILSRAFEPLFGTRRDGTGLGLATTRQIVEQHGGAIELTSRLGKGTRARILLPLADADASNSWMPTVA